MRPGTGPYCKSTTVRLHPKAVNAAYDENQEARLYIKVKVRQASNDSESRPIIGAVINHYCMEVAEDDARKNNLT